MIIQPGLVIYDIKQEYRVDDFIGSGSFGDVWKCHNNRDKTFAVKTLHANFDDEISLKSFINEGKLALEVNHENVINYIFFHDGFKYDKLPPYIIMEFANGGTLENLINDRKKNEDYLKNDELKSFYIQLINGLEAINKKLIHRDIKPDNILISDNKLKITDFGLSKLVSEGTRKSTFKGIGHIKYLSPEGWKSEKNTIQMDIYSMGLVYYELATFQHPLKVKFYNRKEWEDAHLFQLPQNPDQINNDLSLILTQLIMGMIEKRTDKRFKDWSSIRQFLNKDKILKNENIKLVEKFLKQRIEKDTEIEQKRLEQDRKNKEIKDFCNLIKYQYENDIIKPITKFINEFNQRYKGTKINIKNDTDDLNSHILVARIHTPSKNPIEIKLKPILKDDFYINKTLLYFDRDEIVKELNLPKLKDQNILAWGYIKYNNLKNSGINILLIAKSNDVYGEWYILKFISNIISTQQKSELIFFDFNDLKNIANNNFKINNYHITPQILNIDYIIEFIGENII